MIHPTKFRFIWPSDVGGGYVLEINQSEIRIVYGGHVLIHKYVWIRYSMMPLLAPPHFFLSMFIKRG